MGASQGGDAGSGSLGKIRAVGVVRFPAGIVAAVSTGRRAGGKDGR
jgi:hypothetical protein